MSQLLVLRFLQGTGAASLGAINVTIMGDLYSGRERTAAMGYNASILSVGTATFPVVGGALAMLGWYYPFFLSIGAVPIGLFVLIPLLVGLSGHDDPFRAYGFARGSISSRNNV